MDADTLRDRLASGDVVDLLDLSGDREVPAELLVDLLTAAPGGTVRRRVQLANARIVGSLDLHTATLTRSLLLRDCTVLEPIVLHDADGIGLSLRGCDVRGILAVSLRCRGSVDLSDGFTCHGEVRLVGARIDGWLNCTDGTFDNADGIALNLESATVEADVFFRRGFRARGEVNLLGAHVGHLSCSAGTFSNPGGHALVGDGLRVDRNVFCRGGFTAEGEVRLLGAHIGGELDCDTADLANPGGYALNAYGLTVTQDLSCRAGFHARGQVNLVGAHVGGDLLLDDATLENPDGRALVADRLEVRQSVSCADDFTARGEVWLVGARIGGWLDCAGGTFDNADGIALNLESATVDGDVLCRRGFHARGEVNLLSAHVGHLSCSAGTFSNPGGHALVGDGLRVDRSLFCRGGFAAEGEVRLLGARIGGELDCDTADLADPGGYALNAYGLTVTQDLSCRAGFHARGQVSLVGARIGGDLLLDDATLENPDGVAVDLEDVAVTSCVRMRPTRVDGALNLRRAKVATWQDDASTWPGRISLAGFVYGAVEAQPAIGRARRLEWLRRDPAGYSPVAYEQLASVYRREGYPEAARQVLIEKQWRRRASHPTRVRRWPAIAWSSVLRVTIGYGYRPWLMLWPAAALFLLGCWLFAADHRNGLIIPTAARSPEPTFSAVRYTADLLFPVANLGERARFTPLGDAGWHAFAFTLTGWLLALILVAGLTNVFKRD